MTNFFIVKWHNADAGPWFDIIDASWLQTSQPLYDLTHELVGPNGAVIVATFDVEPLPDGTLLFRYGGGNAAANDATQVFLGDMRVDPKTFAKAEFLDWRDEGKTCFDSLAVTIWSEDIEGKISTLMTAAPTRSTRLRAIKRALGRHIGTCDACHDDCRRYGEVRHYCFEVHHRYPLHLGERETGLEDLAYLCANCHRAITALDNISVVDFIKTLVDTHDQVAQTPMRANSS